MPKNRYSKKIEELEKNADFDVDVKPVNQKFVKKMDPNKFKYKHKNIFYKFYSFLVRLVVYILGPIFTFFYFKLRIRGRKNLKAIRKKGAIVVTNHVHTLDSLYIRQISRTRSMYYLAAPFNNKKGLAGLTLRVAGVLPLGNGLKLAKQLDTTIADLLKNKRLLTIYAEESMWMGYTKIRPLKRGAFHYAVKNNSPVVPVVALFRKTNWLDKLLMRKYKVTLQILPAIFPKPELSPKDNIDYMCKTCHQEMVKCANAFYGVECDAQKIYKESTESIQKEESFVLSEELLQTKQKEELPCSKNNNT